MRPGSERWQRGRALAARIGRYGIAALGAATRYAARRWWILFATGLLIAATMAWRSQVGGDQLNLLARGWLLATRGVWVPYGNRTSAGGFEPGGLTSVLVGVPLMLWTDHRAPGLLVLALATIGYLLIDAILPRRGELRRLFAIAYWLNPWRLFYSGHLLNPNYLLFFGALHCATAHRLRTQARFVPSLLHAAALLFAVQLHPSAVMLSLASVLLWWRGRLFVHLAGAVCGAAIGASTLVPFVIRALHDPSVLPGGDGFIGRGLLLVLPVLRGVMYWLRYSSFSFSRTFLQFDYAPALGPVLAWPLETGLSVLQHVVDPLSVIVAAVANVWLLTRLRRRRSTGARLTLGWLRVYVAALFVAALISFGLSPTTVMSWQVVPVLHAAVLPLVLYAAVLGRTPLRGVIDVGVRAWLLLSVVFGIAIAFGAPIFRAEGRNAYAIPLREHVILHELGLAAQSSATLGVATGAHADVLTY